MGSPVTLVDENWQRIQETISRLGGAHAVKVVGVTKGQPLDRVMAGVQAGLSALGDNYVQAGAKLRQQLGTFQGEWHFIGHIQSRKARELTPYDCVESIERASVAEELNRRTGEASRRIQIFAEVNVGEEASKSGVRPDDLENFLDSLRQMPHLELSGLMALPPPLQPVEERRRYFRRMRHLFDQFAGSHGLRWLSMGTSEDYSVAISEGANLIRLGTALFGPRNSAPG